MKQTVPVIFSAVLFLLALSPKFSPVYAVNCTGVPISGNYEVTTACTFANSPVDGIVSGCPANSAVLSFSSTGQLSILNGQTIAVGTVCMGTYSSVCTTVSGASITIIDGGMLKPTTPIYVTDADGDGYPAYGTTQATTGSVCRTSETSLTLFDCGDGNSTAKPSQTIAQTGSFTNTATGLTHDWNCNGTETKTYPTATYTCSACTNGSGYASTVNTTSGFSGSVPACGASGTYYTVTNTTCRDPAVASCTGSYTTSSVPQSCL